MSKHIVISIYKINNKNKLSRLDNFETNVF